MKTNGYGLPVLFAVVNIPPAWLIIIFKFLSVNGRWKTSF